MSFVDTHTHLYHEYYNDNFDEVVKRAIGADVTKFINAGVNRRTPAQIAEAVEAYPENIYGLIGLHPTDITGQYPEDLDFLERHLDDRNIVGVGEIGLDFYTGRSQEREQKEVFYRQLCWARDRKMPLSLHIRDGYAEALEILNRFKAGELSGVLHCFSGGIQEAQWGIAHGFCIGVGGIVTFKNNKLQHIVGEIGLDHIVLETDAPYLAPVPHRGTPNESSYIPLIAEKVADIFGVSVKTVMDATTANARRVFPLAFT